MNKEPQTRKPWRMATLSAVCDKIQDGTHFSPSQESQTETGQYPYVTAKNVKPKGLDLSNLSFLAEEIHRPIYDRCNPKLGDVLLVKDGVNAGDAAINTIEGEISLLSSVCMLRTRPDELIPEFLRYYLLSPLGYRQLLGEMSGTAIKRIILRKIRELSIPLPPVPIQRHIVTRLDELLSDLDAGVAALERAKANLKRYRASVLKAAVEGRLTADWRAAHPDVEPASQLLARILVERRQKWEAAQLAKFAAAGKEPPKGWKEKYVEPTRPDTNGLPNLPAGWCWVTLGQILHGIEGGKSFKCLTRPAANDEWGVIKVSAMTWGNFLEDEQKAIPSSSLFDRSHEIQPNDLLLSRCNTTKLVGATVLVDKCRPRLLLSDKSLRLNISELLDRRWLHRTLSSCVARRQLSAMATGTSDSMRNVSQEKIESVVLPLPPREEQDEIVTELDQRASIISVSEIQLDANSLRATRLRQSILKQAFEGKLVSQASNGATAHEEREQRHPRGSVQSKQGKSAR